MAAARAGRPRSAWTSSSSTTVKTPRSVVSHRWIQRDPSAAGTADTRLRRWIADLLGVAQFRMDQPDDAIANLKKCAPTCLATLSQAARSRVAPVALAEQSSLSQRRSSTRPSWKRWKRPSQRAETRACDQHTCAGDAGEKHSVLHQAPAQSFPRLVVDQHRSAILGGPSALGARRRRLPDSRRVDRHGLLLHRRRNHFGLCDSLVFARGSIAKTCWGWLGLCSAKICPAADRVPSAWTLARARAIESQRQLH